MTQFMLIGHPVGHSVSPAIHHAAYEVLGLAHANYSVIDCPTEADVERVVERLRSGELRGANVTVPHKTLALALSDRVDESAAQVGAANVLAYRDGQIVAYNTDAPALAEELIALVARPTGAALIIGSGGAALASAVSAKIAGFAPVLVTARRFSSEIAPAEWPHAEALSARGVELRAWPLGRPRAMEALLAEVEIVVQATSAGMKGSESGEPLTEFIGPQAARAPAYYDLVYNPPVTPLLREARGAGAQARGGLGMLVRQAARAVEIWLGERPPLEPLQRAAEDALGFRSGQAQA